MSTVTTEGKEQVLELIERLNPSQVRDAIRYLESIVDGGARLEYYKKRREWSATHEEELKAYRGQWVLVEPSGIVAADADHDVVWRRAKELGIDVPLMFRVWENDLPFAGV
jgi:hypothetical protein